MYDIGQTDRFSGILLQSGFYYTFASIFRKTEVERRFRCINYQFGIEHIKVYPTNSVVILIT